MGSSEKLNIQIFVKSMKAYANMIGIRYHFRSYRLEKTSVYDIIPDVTNAKKQVKRKKNHWSHKNFYHCCLGYLPIYGTNKQENRYEKQVSRVFQTCMQLFCTKNTRFWVITRNFTHIFTGIFCFIRLLTLNFVITGLNGSICYCLQFGRKLQLLIRATLLLKN